MTNFIFLHKIFFGSFCSVFHESYGTFFRIDLSLLVFELWAFKVFDFIKGFWTQKKTTFFIFEHQIFLGSFRSVSHESYESVFRIDLSFLVFELWAFEIFEFGYTGLSVSPQDWSDSGFRNTGLSVSPQNWGVTVVQNLLIKAVSLIFQYLQIELFIINRN